jgi:transcription antitermination protein NusB
MSYIRDEERDGVKRRIAREKALQSLFQVDLTGVQPEKSIQYVLEEEPKDVDSRYVYRLVEGTRDHLDTIDTLLSRYSIGWDISRMANVDRNILRMAVYELLYEHDVPPNVVINEAVELAKTFSTYESGKFVNGILGNMVHHLETLRAEATGKNAPQVE